MVASRCQIVDAISRYVKHPSIPTWNVYLMLTSVWYYSSSILILCITIQTVKHVTNHKPQLAGHGYWFCNTGCVTGVTCLTMLTNIQLNYKHLFLTNKISVQSCLQCPLGKKGCRKVYLCRGHYRHIFTCCNNNIISDPWTVPLVLTIQ